MVKEFNAAISCFFLHKIRNVSVLNNLASCYLRGLLRYKTPARDNMRSTEKHLLEENKTKTVAGDRAFVNAAPVLWNQLPQHLRETETLGAFKKGFKTYLFNIAFQKNSY